MALERLDPDLDVAGVCIPHGVFDKVSKDLRDADGIGTDRDRHRWDLNLKGQSLGNCRLFKSGTHIVNQLAEFERLHLR